MTLSITVLVMEGTGALQLVVPMMLAVFIAKVVGDSLGLGIYDLHIKIRGAPVLVSQQHLGFKLLITHHPDTVSDVACARCPFLQQSWRLEPTICSVSKHELVALISQLDIVKQA